MSLENEKELMWSILQADPEYIAHHYAQELLELAARRGKVRFHRRCDELLVMIMNTVQNPLYVAAIVRCWLTHYQLPLDPSKLPSFDRFHNECGKVIRAVGEKGIPLL